MNTELFAARRDALRPLLQEKGLDALLVTYAANRFYLSGFELFDGQCNETSGWLLIKQDGRDVLFTDPRYAGDAGVHWGDNEIAIYKASDGLKKTELVAKHLAPGAKVGLEDGTLSWKQALALAEVMEVVPAQGLVETLRLHKTPEELDALRAACGLNHAVFQKTPDLLDPGKTEVELAWELEVLFRTMGATGMAFSTIAAVNQNAALPHAIPGKTPILEDGLVLVDMGCRLNTYCSDQTRTFWVGEKPSDRFREVVEQVQGAQLAALDVMGPGVPMLEAFNAAQKHFAALGVAEYFTHGLGHGIGLETHEGPYLNARSTGTLEPGMVVTVEPGLYYPEWGGVRWEFMVAITEDGIEVM